MQNKTSCLPWVEKIEEQNYYKNELGMNFEHELTKSPSSESIALEQKHPKILEEVFQEDQLLYAGEK